MQYVPSRGSARGASSGGSKRLLKWGLFALGTFGAALLISAAALAWSASDLDRTITETNFIVAPGCSGTLISMEERLVLTNEHCVKRFIRDVEGKELRKQVPISQPRFVWTEQVASITYFTQIVAVDEERDLALLQLMWDRHYSTEAARLLPKGRRVSRGEAVYAVGNPTGLFNTVTKGIVSGFRKNNDVVYIQFDAPIWFGSSGGALYNDEGYMIGVPKSIMAESGDLNMAVSITEIRGFLEENCWASVYDDEAAEADLKCKEEKKHHERGTPEGDRRVSQNDPSTPAE